MIESMWERCKLDGFELDAKVSKLEGVPYKAFSLDWSVAGTIIERDHIFLYPPTGEHHVGGDSPGWNVFVCWRATVSARTRERPNPSGSKIAPMTVGRGSGPTPLIAAMRAYVDSKAAE